MAVIGSDIQAAKSFLDKDQIIAIPTETVYGLSGNATNVNAVSAIFEAKNRPSFDPLIVHFHDAAAVIKCLGDLPDTAKRLADRFWPGPLTLILRKPARIPYLVTAGLDTVGVRVPRHPLTRELLFQLDYPLAAPSANPFGYVSPTTAQHVEEQLGDRIPYILDGGPCTVGLESTIVGFEKGRATIYRMGGISKEEIEEVIGEVHSRQHSSSNPKAPGMLKSHYSPGKKIILGDISKNLAGLVPERTGVLSFNQRFDEIPAENQLILSPDSQLPQAAQNLFAYLRKFSSMDIDIILAEEVPNTGLGKAINDRLRRAAAK